MNMEQQISVRTGYSNAKKTITAGDAIAAMRRGESLCVLGATGNEGWELNRDVQRAASAAGVDTYGLLSWSVAR